MIVVPAFPRIIIAVSIFLPLLFMSVLLDEEEKQLQNALTSYAVENAVERGLPNFLFGREDYFGPDEKGVIRQSEILNSLISQQMGQNSYLFFDKVEAFIATVGDIIIRDATESAILKNHKITRNQYEITIGISLQYNRNWASIGIFYLVLVASTFLLIKLGLRLFASNTEEMSAQDIEKHAFIAEFENELNIPKAELIDIVNLCKKFSADRLRVIFSLIKELEGLDDLSSKFKNYCTSGVNALSPGQFQWFVAAIKQGAAIPDALEIAHHEFDMTIEPAKEELKIHGLKIPMKATPMCYLAWYAQKRQTADGWVENPNRDLGETYGREIEAILEGCNVDRRAINALYDTSKGQVELTSDILNGNRNRVKTDMKKVLADIDELDFSNFPFELKKGADDRPIGPPRVMRLNFNGKITVTLNN
jgi:hypothetical protein